MVYIVDPELLLIALACYLCFFSPGWASFYLKPLLLKSSAYRVKYRQVKVCPVCDRPFNNRKKWAVRGVWEQVVYCSDKCRRRKSEQKARQTRNQNEKSRARSKND
ncbi:MAG: hypothetical protein CMK59_09000 [Proteobacteria bacterium]|nr:hypothetical protein [Pseudomonadota bacterium]